MITDPQKPEHSGSVLEQALLWSEQGKGVAVATVIGTWGSAPCPTGSQLVVEASGAFTGSVSGGCIEGEVIARALDVITSGTAERVAFAVNKRLAWAAGLACGGRLEIYIEPITADGAARQTGLTHGLLAELVTERRQKRPVVLVTDLTSGAAWLIQTGDENAAQAASFDLRAAVQDCLNSDRAQLVEKDGRRYFLNPFNPPLRLIIVGAVHIAQKLSPMAKLAGYDVTVIDPRTAFATTERFPGTAVVAAWPDEALDALAPDRRTAIAVLSHDPKLDDPTLARALRSACFYIGALGSRKTQAARLKRLRAHWPMHDLVRIKGPVGLAIGARTPAEIAVAILAEMTACLRGSALTEPQSTSKVTALVLAAGRSRRMGTSHKLLSPIGAQPMIRRTVQNVLASGVSEVIVVTGPERAAIEAALRDLPVTLAFNPDTDDGLSSSIKTGLGRVKADCAGVLICLGDMPAVTATHIDRLIAAFKASQAQDICVPVSQGQRGNPVLWPRRYFADLNTITGDRGAKHLIEKYRHDVRAVELPEDSGVLIDIDTPEDLAAFKERSV